MAAMADATGMTLKNSTWRTIGCYNVIDGCGALKEG
jgi:hypothetical protein